MSNSYGLPSFFEIFHPLFTLVHPTNNTEQLPVRLLSESGSSTFSHMYSYIETIDSNFSLIVISDVDSLKYLRCFIIKKGLFENQFFHLLNYLLILIYIFDQFLFYYLCSLLFLVHYRVLVK